MNPVNCWAYCLVALALLGGNGRASPAPASKASAPAVVGTPATASKLSHGRFKDLEIYAPPAAATSVVLFLSGDEGWNSAVAALAQELTRTGALVVGIDLPKFKVDLDADGNQCVFPDGDLENLSHFVQAYVHSPNYLKPTLVGVGDGAAFAYAILTQAPKDTFAAALTLDFCPHLNLNKPLCKGSGFESTRDPVKSGAELKPVPTLGDPWVALQGELGRSCPVAANREFVGKVHGAAFALLKGVGGEPKYSSHWLLPLNAAYGRLATDDSLARVAPTPSALSDLPVVEVPAQPGTPASDAFAIIMSGDGGWAGLDQEVAKALTAKGMPVVGLDSLRYYWTARTPEGLAADTDRMIRYYLTRYDKKRVLLIGYSQGADVLPFAVNRLPAATRASVSLMAILGMSEHALFEFHLASWVSDDNTGPLTLPEVNRIVGMPVLCIYGQDEDDSLCPKLDPIKFKVVKLKGGHHFDGDYAGLAREIIAAAKP